MKMKIEITLDNDAFASPPNMDVELSRILSELAKTCNYAVLEPDHGNLRDCNGNKVGTWELTEE